jgi:hypothetical protein
MMSSLFNVLLGYSTDGVNPFRSGQYTLWPLTVKVLNLPPTFASSTPLLILAGVIHGPKKPKSLQAYQLALADEIAVGYRYRFGVRSVDPATKREIWFRTKLALHSCDGPANCLAANMQGAGAYYGCIRCEICGYRVLNRVQYGQIRRWLPLDHAYRFDPHFGEQETRESPPNRKLENVLKVGAFADWQSSLKPGDEDIIDNWAELCKVQPN